MEIRHFKTSDCDQLAKIFFSTIREINRKDYSLEQVRAWAPENRDPRDWEKTFEGKFIFVAVDSGTLLGFGELEPNGHIDRFYVHKDSIRKGVGKEIYEALEHKARSLGLERLYVDASITAQPFFARQGFTESTAQTVILRGVEFTNFRMNKVLVRVPI